MYKGERMFWFWVSWLWDIEYELAGIIGGSELPIYGLNKGGIPE